MVMRPFEPLVPVHNEEFFDPVFVKERLCLLERDADRGCNEPLLCHQVRDLFRGVSLKTKVPVRQDPDEAPFLDNRKARDPVIGHGLQGLPDALVWAHRDGVRDHPAL